MTSSSPAWQSPPRSLRPGDRATALLRRLGDVNLSRSAGVVLSLGVTGLACLGDALSPAVATFTLFYVLALTVATWYVGLTYSYAIALLATAAHWYATAVAAPETTLTFLAWNATVDFFLYLAFVSLASTVKQRLLNESSAKQEALHQLRHAERLATLGKLASGIAHEVGTPLNVISGRAELIASGDLGKEAMVSSAKIILGQTDRVTAIVRQLLDFARRGGTRKERTNLAALVEHTASLLGPMAAKARVDIATSGAPTEALVNASEMQQVVTNLLTNAIHAMPHGGRVDISLADEVLARPGARRSGKRPCTVLRVRDHGVGISDEDLGRIFEPFFTTRDVGVGTGLGLSVVYGIVQDHGGWIDVATELGEGTTVSVYLPKE
jgi:signal transduction histidine kinase